MDLEHIYKLPNGKIVSTIERPCKDVPQIEMKRATDQQFFGDNGKIDCHFLRNHLFREGKLKEEHIMHILAIGTRILGAEPNLLSIPAPITICGDFHGQFYDLCKVFDICKGEPPAQTYLFLGDYVDRGCFSLECYIYLLALKIRWPQHIFMLRGNHESRHLTRHFTFKLECSTKYSEDVYEECMVSFDNLPLCAVVNEQFFCVHGGLSPELKRPKDVLSINRKMDPPKSGMMCDLLWSDPGGDFGTEEDEYEMFTPNKSRGCSFKYSYHAVCAFLRANNLLAVIRGHEAQDAGYRMYRKQENSEFPALITLFSAANYCDVYNNKGAVMSYDGTLINIQQYKAADHPYFLPKFMNVFDWSLPFICEKISELLMAVLDIDHLSEEVAGLTKEERELWEKKDAGRLTIIRQKIRAIGKINRMFSTIRDERETLTEFMNVTGTHIVPAHYLSLGGETLRDAIKSFEDAKISDCYNEIYPENDDDASSIISLSEEGDHPKELEAVDVVKNIGHPDEVELIINQEQKNLNHK